MGWKGIANFGILLLLLINVKLIVESFFSLSQTQEELQVLKEYSTTHCTPQIYADEDKVDSLMDSIEHCLQQPK